MNNDEHTTVTEVVPEIPKNGNGNYKESIREQLNKIIGDAFDQETREVSRLLREEREKAVAQLVEENRNLIREIVEEGKKIIWGGTSSPVDTENMKTELYDALEDDGSKKPAEATMAEEKPVSTMEWIELEILPPRDQDEIEAINQYLSFHPRVISVELITMVDKSVFRVSTNEPVDFVEDLKPLPQVLDAKRIPGAEHGKIQITLSAKSRLAKTQDDMNARVKKIFHGRR